MSDRDQLFVKVDGYHAVLDELNAVKTVMADMQEALDIIHELRDVKENTVNQFLEHISLLNKRLENIARELPDVESKQSPAVTTPSNAPSQPSGQPPAPEPETTRSSSADAMEEEVIENSVKDLHSELKRLKNSLRDMQRD